MDKDDISEFLETEIVYKCRVCEYRTFDKNGFVEHVRSSHKVQEDTEVYQCDFCGDIFEDQQLLVQHLGTIHSVQEETVSLPVTQEHSEETKQTMKEHNVESVAADIVDEIAEKGVGVPIIIDTSGDPMQTKDMAISMPDLEESALPLTETQLKELLEGNSSMNRLICNQCFQTFRTHEDINKHLSDAHNVTDAHCQEVKLQGLPSEANASVKRLLMCNYCHTTFHSHEEISVHIQTDHYKLEKDGSDTDEDELEVPVQPVIMPVKRGRGRPRKYPIGERTVQPSRPPVPSIGKRMYSDDEEEESEKEPEPAPYVSRSGRIRKRPRMLAQDYVGYSAYVKLENMDAEEEEDWDGTAKVHWSSQLTQSGTPMKKRGRPRKNPAAPYPVKPKRVFGPDGKPIKQKRGRPPKHLEVSYCVQDGADTQETLNPSSVLIKKKRGRPRKSRLDMDEDPSPIVRIDVTDVNEVLQRKTMEQLEGDEAAVALAALSGGEQTFRIGDTIVVLQGGSSEEQEQGRKLDESETDGIAAKTDTLPGELDPEADEMDSENIDPDNPSLEALEQLEKDSSTDAVDVEFVDVAKKRRRPLFHHLDDGSRIYRCSRRFCVFNHVNKYFFTEFEKEIHEKCHTPYSNEFKCCECDFATNQWVVMRRHLWKTHDIEAGILTCNVCGFKSERNFEYEDHMRTHSNKFIYKCTICNRMFKSYKLMKNHERYHGPHYLKGPAGELQCPVCRIGFKCDTHLKEHITCVHLGVELVCEICGFKTRRKETMQVHTTIHKGIKPFRCDQCDFTTSHRSSLRCHKRRHAGFRPYLCPYCPWDTTEATPFRVHLMRKHPESELVHRCPYCCYTTVNKDYMRRHVAQKHPDGDSVQITETLTDEGGGVVEMPDGGEMVTVVSGDGVTEGEVGEEELTNVTEITVLPEENAQAILQLLAMSEIQTGGADGAKQVIEVHTSEDGGSGDQVENIDGPIILQTEDGKYVIQGEDGEFVELQDGHVILDGGDEMSGKVYLHEGELVISDQTTSEQLLISDQSEEQVYVTGYDNSAEVGQEAGEAGIGDASQVIVNDAGQIVESIVTQEATEEC
ncbi:PREDICTED: zinc finger protein ZFAT-like isoform X2 [Priapulus caudatus]|uniref:Zinc finger protein ZFAT-like isoform X2 n=1 Tax=Priapulus caudatus TaxID=37621 RepID=A0ABM1EGN8_PRICU|nr:PREDICTED: zinc finger protein ZFAT-like isoform X2 [Priapulus caudatus]